MQHASTTGAPAPVSHPLATRRIILVVTTISAFITPYLVSSVYIALPSIGKEFALNNIMESWVAIAYLLAATIFLVPLGRIADIYGRKRIFMSGALLISISSFLAAHAGSITMLLSARVLEGVAAAMIFGTGIAILISVYPLQERGRVIGINVAGTYLGLSMGPLLGGWLTQFFGWRSIYMIIVPIGLGILALVLWKVKGEWAEARGERFDLLGTLLYSAAMFAVIYGFTLLPAPSGLIAVLAGILMLVLFIAWELRTDCPVLNMKLFRQSVPFTMSNIAALINYSATSALTFMLSLYLQDVRGLSTEYAGYILVSQPLMQFLFSPSAGRLSDRVEPRLVASVGMGMTAAGLALLIGIDNRTPLGYIVACLILLGLGFALFSSPNTNAVMSSVSKQFYGVASGTLATMRLTGQTLSIGIATMFMVLFMGRVAIASDNFPEFLVADRATFIVFAILCVFGVMASLARGRVHHGGTQPAEGQP